MRKWVVLGAVVAVYAASGHPGMPTAGAPASAKAVAYARGQIGKPYQWGGEGPGAFDCSGLAWMAYGKTIARTSQQQWATERHVSAPRPGDLVFFAGADGTMTSPGHVGIVIGGGKMIEAYGTGYPVRVATWHRADLVGFTDPTAAGAL